MIVCATLWRLCGDFVATLYQECTLIILKCILLLYSGTNKVIPKLCHKHGLLPYLHIKNFWRNSAKKERTQGNEGELAR